MLIPKVGRREHKKAEQKILIMEAFLKALETEELYDIKIEDICGEIGISKVTFFNYFDSKEQALEYFIYKWQYEVSYLLQREKLVCKQALYCIFDAIAEHPAAQHVMNALVLFFLKQKVYRQMSITNYEYYLFNNEAFIKGVKGEGIQGLFAEALKAYKLSDSTGQKLVNSLLAGFYGVPIRTKIVGEKDLKRAYRDFINNLLIENRIR